MLNSLAASDEKESVSLEMIAISGLRVSFRQLAKYRRMLSAVSATTDRFNFLLLRVCLSVYYFVTNNRHDRWSRATWILLSTLYGTWKIYHRCANMPIGIAYAFIAFSWVSSVLCLSHKVMIDKGTDEV